MIHGDCSLKICNMQKLFLMLDTIKMKASGQYAIMIKMFLKKFDKSYIKI